MMKNCGANSRFDLCCSSCSPLFLHLSLGLLHITISLEVKTDSFARIAFKNQLPFQQHWKSCYKSISSNHFQKPYPWLTARFYFFQFRIWRLKKTLWDAHPMVGRLHTSGYRYTLTARVAALPPSVSPSIHCEAWPFNQSQLTIEKHTHTWTWTGESSTCTTYCDAHLTFEPNFPSIFPAMKQGWTVRHGWMCWAYWVYALI